MKKMEASGAVTAKKFWSMLRALYFMIRKGKSKNLKCLLDLSMMIKRHKDSPVNRHHLSNVHPGEYVFSCSNTPLFRVNRPHSSSSTGGYRFFLCAKMLRANEEEHDGGSVNIAGLKALEMLRSPVEHDQDERCVDEAAEEFIIKFYQDLRRQNVITSN